MNLPHFSSVQPSNIVDQIKTKIEQNQSLVERIVAARKYAYDTLVLPIEQADDELSQLWSPVSHMNSVVSSDALREAHDACLPLLSEYGTWMGQHEGLYKAYCELKDSEAFKSFSTAQKKLISNAIRDFKLSGVGLEAEKKQRYAEIQSRLSALSSGFSNNVLDATVGWIKHIEDESQLVGLPESAMAAAKQTALQKGLKGWVFTLDIPSYLPVMQHAQNRALREEMYRAYVTRASDQGIHPEKWDNSSLMQEILSLRHEVAEILGFQHYADLSLSNKMADSVSQVQDFLYELANKSKTQGRKELEAVRTYASELGHEGELQAWDVAFYSERLKEHTFSITDEEIKPYFPENKVVEGLFSVVNRLYGISISEKTDVDVWHPEVRFFEIRDSQSELVGGFYFDLYAREKKRGGAWMDECVVRRHTQDGQLQLPIAYLTCNFSRPVGEVPALFTHDEVVTLFHEFGHGLHHMMTKISVGGVSGINGVPWDAVELPSQFLENWCWQEEALAFISGHYKTDEPLPAELLEKMLAARDFLTAMQMLRQIEFSLFDMSIHQQTSGQVDIQKSLDDVRSQVAVVIPPAFNRFQHSFGHIFAGGYAAGYYSYKWAEVLSSDAFSRFEEEGIFNPDTGQDFLNQILSVGGSIEPMEAFIAFRGREPNIDALLRHNGIAA